jgi:acetyltransferase-like isoleucine patch superfamily enzyme
MTPSLQSVADAAKPPCVADAASNSHPPSSHSTTPVVPFIVSQDPRLVVGRFTYGNVAFLLYTPHDRITVGSFTSFGPETIVFASGEHSTRSVTAYPLRGVMRNESDVIPGSVVIGNDVWIGARTIVLSGVTIGDGAVIGAGSLVTEDVAPYTVVVGNPARFHHHRFSASIIERLLQIRWWDWELTRIREFVDLLTDSTRVEEFLMRAREA